MDLRKCTRCGFRGELKEFQALGEDKRYDLCQNCWVEVRQERLGEITVEVDGAQLRYMSVELSRADFESMLTHLQQRLGLSQSLVTAIRTAGLLPPMERREASQLVYKR